MTIEEKFDRIELQKGKEEGKMKETSIMLSSVDDIRNFVNEVILVNYDVDLVQGRYTIDAKSIMGIFSLNLRSPITLIAHTDNADEFFARIEKFSAK